MAHDTVLVDDDNLPDAAGYGVALAIMKALMPAHLEWRIEFELPAAEAPPAKLGSGSKLGWTSWMGKSPPGKPRRDLRLTPRQAQAF